ncbi:hypothetical protein FVER53590_28830 [Fusarium verticillioides]|nr:hypothetical protein FVER53590_28830 [Fusarium verticillioides]
MPTGALSKVEDDCREEEDGAELGDLLLARHRRSSWGMGRSAYRHVHTFGFHYLDSKMVQLVERLEQASENYNYLKSQLSVEAVEMAHWEEVKRSRNQAQEPGQ